MYKAGKNPFFSIIIPTHNRANDLKLAIKCILMQDFVDFEIIVSDNHSKDETENVIKEFKELRIKYIKNKKDIGWIANLQKAISKAKGKYIILHGDDDFILYDDFLKYLYNFLGKNDYGFVRINYLSQINRREIFKFREDRYVENNLVIKPRRNNYEIINFIEKVDPFFLTGIVFKNSFPPNIKIINSELAPWFKIIFYNIYNHGGCFIAKHFFIASWAQKAMYAFYFLQKGKFTFENYFKEVRRLSSHLFYQEFLDNHLREIIKFFPATKYNTSNNNLIMCSKRIIELSPKYKFSAFFWFWLLSSLLTSKPLLGLMRTYLLNRMINDSQIVNPNAVRKRVSSLRSIE